MRHTSVFLNSFLVLSCSASMPLDSTDTDLHFYLHRLVTGRLPNTSLFWNSILLLYDVRHASIITAKCSLAV